MDYRPHADDARFLLMEVLDAPAQLAALPAMADADPALMAQVLDEAGKFVGEVVAPLNAAGDAPGCRLTPAASPRRRVFAMRTRRSGRPAGRHWPARRRRRPGPALGAGGRAVRMAERGQPWLDHGARAAAWRV
jgi:hypothetical protein